MPVATDKCYSCGTKARPTTSLDTSGFGHYLKPDGQFCVTDFWFCSTICYKNAIRKYLPREYDFDLSFTDTDKYKSLQKTIEENENNYAEDGNDCYLRWAKSAKRDIQVQGDSWRFDKDLAIYQAQNQLDIHLSAEQKHLDDEKYKAAAANTQKLYDEFNKTLAQTVKEHEKEQALLRKQQEADAIKQAEEERWKPRPLDP